MKKIHLSVPKPCHEDWNEMTPNQRGRFCQSCQKTVVDFTNMSDGEVLNFFKKGEGKVCGQFRGDQLDKVYAPLEASWTPQWIKAGLLASSLLTAAGLDAQQISTEQTTVQSAFSQQKMLVRGTVQDESGEPLIGANVSFANTNIGTITDFDGNYTLEIPEALMNRQVWKLSFKYTGYATQRIEMNSSSESIYQLDVILKEADPELASGVVNIRHLVGEAIDLPVHVVGFVAMNPANNPPSSSASSITIRGKITEKDSDEPILFGTVVLLDEQGKTIVATETDFDGNYELEIPTAYLNAEKWRISYQYLGMKNREMLVENRKQTSITQNVRLELGGYLLGIVVSTNPNPYKRDKTVGQYIVKGIRSVYRSIRDEVGQRQINRRQMLSQRISSERTSDIPAFQRVSGQMEKNLTLVYPNPFGDQLQVNYRATREKEIQLYIVDINGKVVLQQQQRVHRGENIINLSPDLMNGNYWLRIESAGEEAEVLAISRIVKE